MPPKAIVGKKGPVQKAKQAGTTIDSRFSSVRNDPRFKQRTSTRSKSPVDNRFQSMFNDADFQQTAVDNFHRVETTSTKKDLLKLYSKTNDPLDKTKSIIVDNDEIADDEYQDDAQNGASDDESTDIGSTDESDMDGDEEELVPEGYTHGSIRGSYAALVENPTKRLALYNMEWEQLSAVDVLAVMRSFCPTGGQIFSCSIYPSQFGLAMMEREKRGDFTLWSDPLMDAIKTSKPTTSKQRKGVGGKNKRNPNVDIDDDDTDVSDSEFERTLYGEDENDYKTIQENQKKLHEYEMGKLRYYYAVISCDCSATALKLYEEVDGLEYEASSNIFDLRFVPDDHQFDEKTLRDRATSVPAGHIPPNYITNCLTSTTVDCTWEREDPRRARLLHQDFTNEEYNVDDLTAFLANTSDEEGFATDVPISETDDSMSDDSTDDEGDSDNNEHVDGLARRRAKSQDTLGNDRIVGTKVENGKKKNIISLKGRARNEFASILSEIHLHQPGADTTLAKKKIISKANKELRRDADAESTSSSDDEDDDEQTKVQPQLKKKKPSIVLQSALNTFAQNIVDTKKKNDHEERLGRLSVWQRQLEQQKIKKQQKKDDKKRLEMEQQIDPKTRTPTEMQSGSLYDDNEIDMDDPFFKGLNMNEVFDENEFGEVDYSSNTKHSSKPKSASKRLDDGGHSDDVSEDDGYNVQSLVKKNKIKQLAIDNKKMTQKEHEDQLVNQALGLDRFQQRQQTQLTERDVKRAAYLVNKTDTNSKKKQKINAEDVLAQHHVRLSSPATTSTQSSQSADFKIDLTDGRFNAVFDDADFGIDVTNTQFLETEGTTQLLAETQRRRKLKQKEHEQTTKKRKFGQDEQPIVPSPITATKNQNTMSDELQSLVGRVKVVSKLNKLSKRK